MYQKIRSDAEPKKLFSEGGIPPVVEMKTLPAWACVALSARCFRRVQPFIATYWPEMPTYFKQALEELVLTSERKSSEGEPLYGPGTMDELISPVSEAFEKANDLRKAAFGPDGFSAEKAWVATACQNVIWVDICTGYAQKAAISGRADKVAENGMSAAEHAAKAVKANFQIVADIRADFDDVLAACRANGTRHFDPSPLTFFTDVGPPAFVDYNSLA